MCSPDAQLGQTSLRRQGPSSLVFVLAPTGCKEYETDPIFQAAASIFALRRRSLADRALLPEARQEDEGDSESLPDLEILEARSPSPNTHTPTVMSA